MRPNLAPSTLRYGGPSFGFLESGAPGESQQEVITSDIIAGQSQVQRLEEDC
jgi:hypothetical protein